MRPHRSPLFTGVGQRTELESALCRTAFTPAQLSGSLLWLRSDWDVFGDAAVDFNGSSQYLSIAHGSQTGLTLDNTSFTLAAWVMVDAATGDDVILGKFKWSTNERAYALVYRQSTQRFEFWLSSNGTSLTQLASSSSYGMPTAWLFVVARYNLTAGSNQMRLSVNNGTVTQASLAGGAYAGTTTAPFVIGADSVVSSHFDGRVDSAAVWNRELSDAEVTALFALGAGLGHAQLSPALLTGLVSWWNLDEASGNRNDQQGSNHLAATGSPSRAAGIAVTTPGDEDTIGQWLDQADRSRSAIQATFARRPLRETTSVPLPLVKLDGVDDFLTLDATVNLSNGFTLAWVAQPSATPSTVFAHASVAGSFVRHASSTQVQISDGTDTRTFTHSAPGGLAVHAIVGNASGLNHYVNGVASSASGTSFSAVTWGLIGARTGIAEPFAGLLGDLVAINRPVGSDELYRLGRFLAGRHRLTW